MAIHRNSVGQETSCFPRYSRFSIYFTASRFLVDDNKWVYVEHWCPVLSFWFFSSPLPDPSFFSTLTFTRFEQPEGAYDAILSFALVVLFLRLSSPHPNNLEFVPATRQWISHFVPHRLQYSHWSFPLRILLAMSRVLYGWHLPIPYLR